MEIKEAIGQSKPFRNSRHKVIVNVLFSHNWLIAQLRAFFKPFDITEKQYNILRILNGAGGPISTSTIRNRLLDKMSDTTRVIDRMIKKGLVQKSINESDRRLVNITLSPKGKKLLDHVDTHMANLDNIVDALAPDQADTLSELLDNMRGKQ